MSSRSPRVIAVRDGRVQPSGSWLYVWIEVESGAIVYVGCTGFDPELRAYLHVESEDSQLGRVRATVPRYDERDFEVLAFELSEGVDRQAAKQALVAHLTADDAVSELRDVTEPIIQAIARYRGRAGQGSFAVEEFHDPRSEQRSECSNDNPR